MNIPPSTIKGVAKQEEDNEFGIKFWYICYGQDAWRQCSLPLKEHQHLPRINLTS
jgi:hypothetical protein